jgi:hypothetical protein
MFRGKITHGRLRLADRAKFERLIMEQPDGEYTLSLSKDSSPKSRQLERWMHGVAVPMIAKETGQDPDDIWEFLKLKLRPSPMFIGGDMVIVGKSTAGGRMSIEEQLEFKEQIQAWAASFLSLSIPDPNEEEL